ncbi:MAG: rhodanese-like domain-containing protein, partial [Kofleriaceae bacterium]
SFGCSEKSASKEKTEKVEHELPEISIADVAAGIEAKSLTVIDCNSNKTREKVGVLPGAILVEDEETYPASILPADRSSKLVFYCGGPG